MGGAAGYREFQLVGLGGVGYGEGVKTKRVEIWKIGLA